MLESEAKKFKCPLINSFEAVGDIRLSKPGNCIGSECKLWEAHNRGTNENSKGDCSIIKDTDTTNYLLQEIQTLLRDRLS